MAATAVGQCRVPLSAVAHGPVHYDHALRPGGGDDWADGGHARLGYGGDLAGADGRGGADGDGTTPTSSRGDFKAASPRDVGRISFNCVMIMYDTWELAVREARRTFAEHS